MASASTDRNLLFGILAVQTDLISRDALIKAMNAWVLEKSKSLGQILLEQGALAADEHALLEGLVQKQLAKHGNDTGKSLAAVSSVPSVRRELEDIADPDLQVSLAHVGVSKADHDSNATRAPSVGTATSAGTRFRILRPHARGGLGEVYVAHDEELHREVALKEIQDRHADNPDSRSRFMVEAEITGGLEHPGIVPVYGLGQYGDGRPFYAMRFIRGDSLKDAIEHFHKAEGPQRDPGERTLALRKLLGRFIDVCNAIAYAHSRGVLHRDLKPGNIMLGKYGETLVVDWGLAKPLGRKEAETTSSEEAPLQPASSGSLGETLPGSAVGTPQYMSPEQAAGRLDLLGPASDVYSLGATLYCLLTGRVPLGDADLGVLLQKVQKGDFPRPRAVNRQVHPGLEAVCLKAMALRPEERYASPRSLAEDIEHWLADEPVAAYREPWTERAGRWMKRHRTGVTAGVAAAAVAAACLTAATVLLAAANQRERRAKDDATLQRDEARKQQELAEAASQREREAKEEATRERDEARKQGDRADRNLAKARKAVEDYCTNVAEDKRLKQADFHDLRKKLLETAVPFYQEFVEQKADDPELQADRGEALGRLAHLRAEMGETAEAMKGCRQTLEVFTELARAYPAVPGCRQNLATAHNTLGHLLSDLGQRKEAEAEYRQARAAQEKLAADFPTVPDYRFDLAICHHNLGLLLMDLGQLKEAEAEYSQTLAVFGKLAADFPTVPKYRQRLAGTHNILGVLFRNLGQWKEAEAECHQALTAQEKLAADFPTVPDYRLDLAQSHHNLGLLLMDLGQRKEAEAEYSQALAVFGKLAADFPTVPAYRQDLATAHINLGALLSNLGQRKEAEAEFRQALALEEKLAADFPTVPEYRQHLATAHINLGALLAGLGQRKEAEAEDRQALAVFGKLAADFPTVPEYRQHLATAHINLGILLAGLGQRKEAEAEDRQALAVQEKLAGDFPTVPDYRWGLAKSHFNLGLMLLDLGQRKEAEAEDRQALAVQEKLAGDFPTVPDYRWGLALCHRNLGILLRDLGQGKEAEAEDRQALAVLEKLAQDFPTVPGYAVELARSYFNMALLMRENGQPGEAVEWFTKAASTLKDLLAKDNGLVEAQQLFRRIRMSRAIALAATGKPTEAVAEATTLAEGKDATPLLYDAACVFSGASAAAKADAKLAEQYATRAVELLVKAREAGYFKDPATVENMKKDTDLDALRSRDDFKKFFQEVEGRK